MGSQSSPALFTMLMGEDICGPRRPDYSQEHSVTQHDCVLPHRRPMYSNFVTQNSRLETFATWPIQLAQTPSELASAGFFYTGCGDKVRCFSGGCGLEMWEPGDRPRLEHSKWYPDCSFVRMMGELHTETENYGRNGSHESPENTGEGVTKNPGPAVNIRGNTGEDKELSETESNSEYDHVCKICLVETVKVVFVPCGHFLSCSSCAPSLDNCPVCRTDIKGMVRA